MLTDSLTLICHDDDRARMERNLLDSIQGVWTGRTVLLSGFRSLAAAYAYADNGLETELGLYVHGDVCLSAEFFLRLEKAITAVSQAEPNWALLGVIGTFWEPKPSDDPNIDRNVQAYHGHVFDSTAYRAFGPLLTAHPVEALDGCVVVKKRNGPTWDPRIPGFHAVVEDACLQAKAMQRGVWAAGIPVIHNSKLPNIDVETDPGYLAAKRYVMQKWAHVRPIVTCSQVWR